MSDSFRMADIRNVFEEIIQNVPADVLTRSRSDITDSMEELEQNLSNIRRAIDAHLAIRKPHLEVALQ